MRLFQTVLLREITLLKILKVWYIFVLRRQELINTEIGCAVEGKIYRRRQHSQGINQIIKSDENNINQRCGAAGISNVRIPFRLTLFGSSLVSPNHSDKCLLPGQCRFLPFPKISQGKPSKTESKRRTDHMFFQYQKHQLR